MHNGVKCGGVENRARKSCVTNTAKALLITKRGPGEHAPVVKRLLAPSMTDDISLATVSVMYVTRLVRTCIRAVHAMADGGEHSLDGRGWTQSRAVLLSTFLLTCEVSPIIRGVPRRKTHRPTERYCSLKFSYYPPFQFEILFEIFK